jgi:hypothetical protein
MKYTLLIYENTNGFALRNDPEKRQAYWAAWPAYSKALKDAGVFVGGAGLELPGSATTVRLQNGKRHVQDGPYADTKEQLGGYYVIDVPNLDAALEWAARVPAAPGSYVEVRPNLAAPVPAG